MHADEFRAIALEFFSNPDGSSDGWSNRLSYALRINDKTIREIAKGNRPVPEAVATYMRFIRDGAAKK